MSLKRTVTSSQKRSSIVGLYGSSFLPVVIQVCHRLIEGRPVYPRVSFLVACNPYRLKPKDSITVGLDKEQKRTHDPLAALVYRVHPLPTSLLSYLWDFGSLSPEDELAYIRTIVLQAASSTQGQSAVIPDAVRDLAPDMVVMAHRLVRVREDASAVSLRDVRRFTRLLVWFMEHNHKTRPAPSSTSDSSSWISGDRVSIITGLVRKVEEERQGFLTVLGLASFSSLRRRTGLVLPGRIGQDSMIELMEFLRTKGAGWLPSWP